MLKEKNYDKKDVLDESLVIANVREMSRKELETELYFCNRNRRVEEIVNGKEKQT